MSEYNLTCVETVYADALKEPPHSGTTSLLYSVDRICHNKAIGGKEKTKGNTIVVHVLEKYPSRSDDTWPRESDDRGDHFNSLGREENEDIETVNVHVNSTLNSYQGCPKKK